MRHWQILYDESSVAIGRDHVHGWYGISDGAKQLRETDHNPHVRATSCAALSITDLIFHVIITTQTKIV